MPDYSKGKIYTIRKRNDPSLVYVGSTINPLYKRFGQHKKDMKFVKISLYDWVENWDDWYIELYENFSCNSIQELRKREGEVIREIGNINKYVAGRTKKEYNAEFPEKKKEMDKKYRERTKDRMKEYMIEYKKENKEKIKSNQINKYM